jgi:hypothetical protein
MTPGPRTARHAAARRGRPRELLVGTGVAALVVTAIVAVALQPLDRETTPRAAVEAPARHAGTPEPVVSANVTTRAPALGGALPGGLSGRASPAAEPDSAVVAVSREGPERAVRRAVLAALGGSRGAVELAITDVTGRQVVLVGSGRPVRTASIVKLLVLRAALARGPLDRTEEALARRMITGSDNAATTQLWRRVGRDRAVALAAAALGMKATTRIRVLFQPWDGWQTTAADQVRLLRAIATGRDAASRFVRTLMAQVVPEQAWGVGAVTGATGVKNGWVPVAGRWVVNSDGCVARQRTRLCLSVLTTGSRTFGEGIGTVERAAAAAVRAWAGA